MVLENTAREDDKNPHEKNVAIRGLILSAQTWTLRTKAVFYGLVAFLF